MPVRKRRQKPLKVSDFTLLLVVFKWHHGNEGAEHPAGLGNPSCNAMAWLVGQYKCFQPQTFSSWSGFHVWLCACQAFLLKFKFSFSDLGVIMTSKSWKRKLCTQCCYLKFSFNKVQTVYVVTMLDVCMDKIIHLNTFWFWHGRKRQF